MQQNETAICFVARGKGFSISVLWGFGCVPFSSRRGTGGLGIFVEAWLMLYFDLELGALSPTMRRRKSANQI